MPEVVTRFLGWTRRSRIVDQNCQPSNKNNWWTVKYPIPYSWQRCGILGRTGAYFSSVITISFSPRVVLPSSMAKATTNGSAQAEGLFGSTRSGNRLRISCTRLTSSRVVLLKTDLRARAHFSKVSSLAASSSSTARGAIRRSCYINVSRFRHTCGLWRAGRHRWRLTKDDVSMQ